MACFPFLSCAMDQGLAELRFTYMSIAASLLGQDKAPIRATTSRGLSTTGRANRRLGQDHVVEQWQLAT
jgi:hypothetical protein